VWKNFFLPQKLAPLLLDPQWFDHWQLVNGDPRDPAEKVSEIVKAIRKRKGLKEEIPGIDNYFDKL
jgi:hypothetical protein